MDLTSDLATRSASQHAWVDIADADHRWSPSAGSARHIVVQGSISSLPSGAEGSPREQGLGDDGYQRALTACQGEIDQSGGLGAGAEVALVRN